MMKGWFPASSGRLLNREGPRVPREKEPAMKKNSKNNKGKHGAAGEEPEDETDGGNRSGR
jgi:hypothetical protein